MHSTDRREGGGGQTPDATAAVWNLTRSKHRADVTGLGGDGDRSAGPCTVEMALNTQLRYLGGAVTGRPAPGPTNRSSRRRERPLVQSSVLDGGEACAAPGQSSCKYYIQQWLRASPRALLPGRSQTASLLVRAHLRGRQADR